MASTASTNKLEFGQYGPVGHSAIKHGIGTLSSGTVNIDPGMARVDAFFVSPVSLSTATKHLVLTVEEDFPYSTTPNAITVKGLILDDDSATLADVLVDATTEQFAWLAIGEL